MLRLKVIACDVLNREISYLSSQSACYIDTAFLHQGLHDTPDKLNTMLQDAINQANGEFPYNYFNSAPNYDYIIIGYGLCSNGISGITSEKIPLVIPRAHDCITLLLGSKERYQECFASSPGTYWFSPGWIERGWQPSELKYTTLYNAYVDKYGEDNADFLMETEQSWLKGYRNAAYIKWKELGYQEYYLNFTRNSAKFFNWDLHELEGDPSLMERILNGVFNENEVLIVPPGSTIVPSYDEKIIKLE